MFVALVIQYAKRMVPSYIVSCSLSGLNFLNRFSKNIQASSLKKILPVGTELSHADRRTDGQTDMRKMIVAFFAILRTRLKRSCLSIYVLFISRCVYLTIFINVHGQMPSYNQTVSFMFLLFANLIYPVWIRKTN